MGKKKSRRAARADRLGLALLGIAILIAAGATFGYWRLSQTRLELDLETYCPTSGPHGVTVVLLDRTDSLTPVQAASVRNRLEALRETIGKHELLVMYTVESTHERLLKPVVEICNPGKGDDLGGLVDNPRLARRKWEEGFSRLVNKAVDAVLEHNPAATSPIMESLQSVGIEPLRRHQLEGVSKRLIVVSDMLQHTPEISHYRGVPDFDQVAARGEYLRLQSHLTGVAVAIWYLRRPNAGRIQRQAHVEFWQKYFRATGGRLERVISIEG